MERHPSLAWPKVLRHFWPDYIFTVLGGLHRDLLEMKGFEEGKVGLRPPRKGGGGGGEGGGGRHLIEKRVSMLLRTS